MSLFDLLIAILIVAVIIWLFQMLPPLKPYSQILWFIGLLIIILLVANALGLRSVMVPRLR